MTEDQNIEGWLKDCVTISDHQGQIQNWLDNNESVVFVYYPDIPRVDAFPSVWALASTALRSFGLTPVCSLLWKVLLERMDSLRAVAAGERPEGRPLSIERDLARRMFSQGVTYDQAVWMIKTIIGTHFGDANLDGGFDTSDLVQVFQVGEYEDGIDENSTWGDGDWTGDGDFGTADLVVAFQDGGFSAAANSAQNQHSDGDVAAAIRVLAEVIFHHEPMDRSPAAVNADAELPVERTLDRHVIDELFRIVHG